MWTRLQPAFQLLWKRLYHHDAQQLAERAVPSAATPQAAEAAPARRTFASLAADKRQESEAMAAAQSVCVPVAMELPYVTKYVLVAAYLASYNPASTDIKFFTRDGSGKRRQRRSTRRMAV